MEAKELMIGDWVDLSDVDEDIIPCKVVELHTDELLIIQPQDIACDIVGYDMVRPILLTPEILERNGWEHGEISMKKRADENTHFCWTDRYGAVLYRNLYHICDCKDVHTLQHALRLCGMTDLADNFKIE